MSERPDRDLKAKRNDRQPTDGETGRKNRRKSTWRSYRREEIRQAAIPDTSNVSDRDRYKLSASPSSAFKRDAHGPIIASSTLAQKSLLFYETISSRSVEICGIAMNHIWISTNGFRLRNTCTDGPSHQPSQAERTKHHQNYKRHEEKMIESAREVSAQRAPECLRLNDREPTSKEIKTPTPSSREGRQVHSIHHK